MNKFLMSKFKSFPPRLLSSLLVALFAACTNVAAPIQPTPSTGLPLVQFTSVPSVTRGAHLLGPEPTPFATLTPLPGTTRFSNANVTQVISATSSVQSTRVNDATARFALDEQFIYWVSEPNAQLFRLAIDDGEKELLASSQFNQYDDGYLFSDQIISTNKWLIFMDTRVNDTGIWALRALNLTTKQDKILMQETGSHAPMWSPAPDYSAEGDWLAWTRLELGDATRCDQSILGMTNLATDEERELERVCTADHYIWTIPHLSGDNLIVEQDLPDKQGRRNNIFLWNWKTGERKALTTNGYSSMPSASGKWVVWKNAPRYTQSREYVIYNLDTEEQKSFQGLGCWSDPRTSGHWLYSSVCKRVPTIYDMERERMVAVGELSKGDSLSGIAFSDKWAVWGVARDTAAGKEYEIQWRRLP